jgi:hypothetical protein
VVGTNSYIDVADATAYLVDHINAADWSATSATKQAQALVTATRMLDRQPWLGTKYQQAPTQVLDWPRSGLTDDEGQEIDETAVPQFILDATCELALALIQDDSIQSSRNTGSNLKRAKAGSAEVEFFATGTSGPRFPTIIHELVGDYLEGSSSFSGPLATGTENESQLEDYDLNGSY